jgi:hypothetical protein
VFLGRSWVISERFSDAYDRCCHAEERRFYLHKAIRIRRVGLISTVERKISIIVV